MKTETGRVLDNGVGVGVGVCATTDQNSEAAAVRREFPKLQAEMRALMGQGKLVPVASGIRLSCKAEAKVCLISSLMTNTDTAGCGGPPGTGGSSSRPLLAAQDKRQKLHLRASRKTPLLFL